MDVINIGTFEFQNNLLQECSGKYAIHTRRFVLNDSDYI